MFTKNKNKIILIIISILVIIGVCTAITYIKSNNNGNNNNDDTVQYQILDESVLSKSELKDWVDENAKIKGTYTTSDNEHTYILISAGEVQAPGVGIALDKVNKGWNLEVEYSIIDGGEGKVEKYIPKMLIEVPKTDKSIKLKEVPFN